ncbi:MAG: hypothetical protein L0Y67_05220 [Gammaproteobacteria bacterium]|nr:hypothetical protein [Gammaproteobacteria bacterium]
MKPDEILQYFKRDAIPEVRIGVFGESGAGKTTLLTAYYGNLRKDKWLDEHKYSILADDGEQGRFLYDKYVGLANDRVFPAGTSMFAEYSFQLQLQNPQKPSDRLTPPPLRIRWYDYPGKWWTQQPNDPGEYKSRKEAIHKLLTSQVGMLVFDGAKLRTQGFRYLRSVLVSFIDEVRRHKLDIETYTTADDGLTHMYPKHWILALSKCDLFHVNFSAKEFMESLLANAGVELDELGRVIGKEKPYRWAFLLLSSAQGDGTQVISADEPRGLELIAPIALLAPLEQIGNASIPKEVTKQVMKGTVWTLDKAKTLIAWAAGTGAAVADATGPRTTSIATPDGLFAILFAVALTKILEKSASYLTRSLEKAARDGHIFDAAICAMQMELMTDESRHLYYDDHLIQREERRAHDSFWKRLWKRLQRRSIRNYETA